MKENFMRKWLVTSIKSSGEMLLQGVIKMSQGFDPRNFKNSTNPNNCST